MRMISNIQIMHLALKHHQQIQCTVAVPTITLAWIEEWDFLVNFYKAAKLKRVGDSDVLPTVIMTDWAKMKDKIVEHFTEVYGLTSIPLAYLLHDESDVKVEGEDNQDNYEGDHLKELIVHAPHEGATYTSDNWTLCHYLKKICEDTPAFEYIKKFKANGHEAWVALLAVYLGPQHTQIQAALYEAKLQNTMYKGESSCFTFAKLVNIHKQSHTCLEGLTDYGYKNIDEGTKIRYLLNAIQTDKLNTIIEFVHTNDAYPTFDAVVHRFMDSIESTPIIHKYKHDSRDGDEPFPGVEADMMIEDKFYLGKQWHSLTKAQKKGVLLKCKAHGSKAKAKQPKAKEAGGIKRLQKQISAFECQIFSFQVADDDAAASDAASVASHTSTPDDEDARPTKRQKAGANNNRNNANLHHGHCP